MTRCGLLSSLVAVALLLASWPAATQTPKAPRPVRTEGIRGDLHLVSGEGGNVALLVTTNGVVLVDDMFDRNSEGILAAIRAVTPQPLRYVFNTHQHDDHAGGDARLLPLAEIIGHRNMRANLATLKRPYYEETPGTPIGLPRVTFADEASVFLGGQEVRALYFGRGHTSGDAVVYFPALKVVHTGDLFLARTPRRGPDQRPAPLNLPIYVDYVQGGSFREWSATLTGLLALDFDLVIPGHGPLSTRADLGAFKADLDAMRARLTTLIAGGTSRAALLQILEADYGWRSSGCPPSPPSAGCLQYQQIDALISELKG